MQLIFVDGSKLTTEDGIAIYCSRKIGRFPETSSLQQEAQLILDINETLTIRCKALENLISIPIQNEKKKYLPKRERLHSMVTKII